MLGSCARAVWFWSDKLIVYATFIKEGYYVACSRLSDGRDDFLVKGTRKYERVIWGNRLVIMWEGTYLIFSQKGDAYLKRVGANSSVDGSSSMISQSNVFMYLILSSTRSNNS